MDTDLEGLERERTLWPVGNHGMGSQTRGLLNLTNQLFSSRQNVFASQKEISKVDISEVSFTPALCDSQTIPLCAHLACKAPD